MSATAPKRENLLINLVCNIVLPTLVLTKLSTENRLGPLYGLIVALAFPLGYGVYDFVRRKKTNLFSVIGLLSVMATGGLGLFKAETSWFAYKEAAVPLVLGVAVLVSARTKRPLVREVLYNDQVIDVPKVDAALAARGETAAFDRLLRASSLGLAASFLLSAILNYGLARYLLKSPAGTPEFNEQLGKMNFLSWPVIVIPTTIVTMIVLWRLMHGLTRLTGLPFEDIFHASAQKESAPKK